MGLSLNLNLNIVFTFFIYTCNLNFSAMQYFILQGPSLYSKHNKSQYPYCSWNYLPLWYFVSILPSIFNCLLITQLTSKFHVHASFNPRPTNPPSLLHSTIIYFFSRIPITTKICEIFHLKISSTLQAYMNIFAPNSLKKQHFKPVCLRYCIQTFLLKIIAIINYHFFPCKASFQGIMIASALQHNTFV